MAFDSGEKLKVILMEATMARFSQMQKDLEVQIAAALAVQAHGLGEGARIAIAVATSKDIVGFLEREVMMNKRIEHVVDSLL